MNHSLYYSSFQRQFTFIKFYAIILAKYEIKINRKTKKGEKMLEKRIIAYRRHIHQHPELGYETYQTAHYIYEELRDMGYEPTYICHQAGVVARLENHQPKTIAFRSDIDALPIQEETQLPFQSTNGCMHACGHDAHAAMLLGAAKLLKEHQQALTANVIIIFQPAEEGPLPGGSVKVMEDYDFSDVSSFFAFHVTNKLKTGQVGIKPHAACAAPDLWECCFTGKGSHGATPNLGINPILPAAETALAYEHLYEELKDPYQVISTTYIQSGVSMNIILDKATIKGTARSFQEEDRNALANKMKELADHIAAKYQAQSNFIFHYAYDPVFNDDLPYHCFQQAIEQVLGKGGFVQLPEPEMVGEDFSHYRRIAPTCLAWIGVRGPQQDFYDLHSASFLLDEQALLIGSQIYLEIAKNYR